jgi:hypothetical protein
MRVAPYIAIAAVVSAAAFALVGQDRAPAHASAVAPSAPVADDLRLTTTLPPNHPMIGAGGAPIASVRPVEEPPAIAWTVPDGWQAAPNPNAMRIATYRVPAAAGDDEDAEVTVSRAGGTTDANIQRWLGQFDDAGKDTRVEAMVRGMKVTIVDVKGTYVGGMTPSAQPRRGFALVGAIVETLGSPYFVKMIGPAKTVSAARPAFEKLVRGITPA